MTLDNLSITQPIKQTVFNQALYNNLQTNPTNDTPSDWEYVLFIGHDTQYGDVFKVWNNDEEDNFTLMFGEKGDEF